MTDHQLTCALLRANRQIKLHPIGSLENLLANYKRQRIIQIMAQRCAEEYKKKYLETP